MESDHATLLKTSMGAYHSENKIQTPFHDVVLYNVIPANFSASLTFAVVLLSVNLPGLDPFLSWHLLFLEAQDLIAPCPSSLSPQSLQRNLP